MGGFAICLLLPPAALAFSTFLQARSSLPPAAAFLASGAAAFVVASAAFGALERRRGRSRPGTPQPSVEREKLAALTAGDVARPLEELVSAPQCNAPEEILAIMRRTGCRWVALRRDRIGSASEAVPLRHLVLPHEVPFDARSFALPMPRIQADLAAIEALHALPPGAPPAIVEFEGTPMGFLTRHDLAQAALGPLPCGRPQPRPAWLRKGPGAIVAAGVPASEVLRRLGDGPGETAGADSIAEALRLALGRTLALGESAEWKGLRVSVEESVAHEPVRFRIEPSRSER